MLPPAGGGTAPLPCALPRAAAPTPRPLPFQLPRQRAPPLPPQSGPEPPLSFPDRADPSGGVCPQLPARPRQGLFSTHPRLQQQLPRRGGGSNACPPGPFSGSCPWRLFRVNCRFFLGPRRLAPACCAFFGVALGCCARAYIYVYTCPPTARPQRRRVPLFVVASTRWHLWRWGASISRARRRTCGLGHTCQFNPPVLCVARAKALRWPWLTHTVRVLPVYIFVSVRASGFSLSWGRGRCGAGLVGKGAAGTPHRASPVCETCAQAARIPDVRRGGPECVSQLLDGYRNAR